MRSRNNIFRSMAGLVCRLMTPVFIFASCNAPVSNSTMPVEDTFALSLLSQPAGHTVISRQSVVCFGPVADTGMNLLNGIIMPDERNSNSIAARFSGRIEKLYVNYPYQYVRKGEKVMDVYSEEVSRAIAEYLLVWKKDHSSSLSKSAYQNLIRFGLHADQIRAFETSGVVPASVAIYSSYEGYVIPSSGPGGSGLTDLGNRMNSMNGMNNENDRGQSTDPSTATGVIRAGAYFRSGQTLFTVNNATTVLAIFNVPEGVQQNFSKETSIRITSIADTDDFRVGKIDLVEPVIRDGQHSISIRVTLENPGGKLKFNAQVKGASGNQKGMLKALPSSCVLDLGKRKIVWIRTGQLGSSSVFVPREVMIGGSENGFTEITSGLKEGEAVALNAGLMVDRDVIIQTELP